MITDEEIRLAGVEHTIKHCPRAICGNEKIMIMMNQNHDFEEGAKWAIEKIKSKIATGEYKLNLTKFLKT